MVRGKLLMLSDVLKKEYIELNVECSDWIEAVKKAGEILIKNEVITNEYVEEAIKGVKELGPYIVITKGVALPHATNKVGVNKTGISLVTLKNPVEFGNKDNDPVYYIFMLATTDTESHLSALSNLSELLGKKEFFEIMKNAKDSQSVIDYIKANEN